jgi:hypothetical protein
MTTRHDVNRTGGVEQRADTGGRQGGGYDGARRNSQQPGRTETGISSHRVPEYREPQPLNANAYADGGIKWFNCCCKREQPRSNPPQEIPLRDLSPRSGRGARSDLTLAPPATSDVGQGIRDIGMSRYIDNIQRDINSLNPQQIIERTREVTKQAVIDIAGLGTNRDYVQLKKKYDRAQRKLDDTLSGMGAGGHFSAPPTVPDRAGEPSSGNQRETLASTATNLLRHIQARLESQ